MNPPIPDPILRAIHYVPIGTTVLSAIFCAVLLHRYLTRRSGPHLLWWAFGIFTYGVGTALESFITLHGNTPALNKAWYIAGAIFGGYPLAQGSVYLLLKRRTANLLSALTLPVIAVATIAVLASPIRLEALETERPGGAALGWQWVRLLTPIINLYSLAFLAGGAALSAWRYARRRGSGSRALGNTLIAVGAVMPAIGGTLAKAGLVEGLYVGEFVGVILIWLGYAACVRGPVPAAGAPQAAAPACSPGP